MASKLSSIGAGTLPNGLLVTVVTLVTAVTSAIPVIAGSGYLLLTQWGNALGNKR
jgi:hypothetical protein